MNIKLLTQALYFCYLNQSNKSKVLKMMTEALDIADNEDWKEYIRKADSLHANEYLVQNDLEKLKTDGRTLRDYPEDKITTDLLEIAIRANRPLTFNMIKTNKKFRSKLTNKLLLSLQIENRQREPWLSLWNEKESSFLDEFTINEPKILFNILYITSTFTAYSSFESNNKMYSKLNLPKELHTFINTVAHAKKICSRDIDHVFFENDTENELLMNYLKLRYNVNLYDYVGPDNQFRYMNNDMIEKIIQSIWDYYKLDLDDLRNKYSRKE